MAKTAKQVQTDVYTLLRDSTLYTLLSGEVYRNGLRPRDSRLEDAVVTFTTGLPDEIQTGVVTINIYVPDIDPYDNGVFVEDGERTAEVEALAQAWVDSLSCEVSNYRFKLQQTIYTEAEPELNQHFVVVKLTYRYFGGDFDKVKVPQAANVAIETEGYEPTYITEDEAEIEVTPVVAKSNH